MSANFKINIPSIPSNKIRFKIQDVRQKGFLTKQNRFMENKQYLTKKFINSFNNLSQKKPIKQQTQQSLHKSQISTNESSFFKKQADNFRWMIGQNKKNLLIKYQDKYKNYIPPIKKQQIHKGYSFSKSTAHYDTQDTQLLKQSSLQIEDKKYDKSFSNYYSNQILDKKTQYYEEQNCSDQEDYKKKKQQKIMKLIEKRNIKKPSAAFQGQDRWQFFERNIRNKPQMAPGQYNPQISQKNRQKSLKGQKDQQNNKQKHKFSLPVNKLKTIIQTIFDENQNDYKNNEQIVYKKFDSSNNQTSSFVLNNSDRFGNPVYAIVDRSKALGPGSYQINNQSIQEKTKKLIVLEQQRILLKQWYNQK